MTKHPWSHELNSLFREVLLIYVNVLKHWREWEGDI